jgi:TP901 family phage tail tape measure protein
MKGEIGRIGNQMRAAGRVMTTYITLPIVAAGAMAVKTAAEFETSMRQIAVATGAPNKELKKMEKLAIKLGADTIYSANEAAEAMLELAKSGITPAQISAGALESTLALAAASGLDMAQSAVVMGTSLNAFHLEAKDSKGAVDALAGAANASSAEVKDIALALQQVSAMAYQSGLSIQETTAVLAAFADSGIRGSDAGTSFKVFLQRLNPVTDGGTWFKFL